MAIISLQGEDGARVLGAFREKHRSWREKALWGLAVNRPAAERMQAYAESAQTLSRFRTRYARGDVGTLALQAAERTHARFYRAYTDPYGAKTYA